VGLVPLASVEYNEFREVCAHFILTQLFGTVHFLSFTQKSRQVRLDTVIRTPTPTGINMFQQ
jgi:hypothetical protein